MTNIQKSHYNINMTNSSDFNILCFSTTVYPILVINVSLLAYFVIIISYYYILFVFSLPILCGGGGGGEVIFYMQAYYYCYFVSHGNKALL